MILNACRASSIDENRGRHCGWASKGMRLYKTDIEQQIIRQFGRGDASAMSLLYNEFAPLLAGVCSRYITDADERKDVLQEAFIQIYTHINKFSYQGVGSLKAWMIRITVNQALMSLRQKTSFNMVDSMADIPDTADETPDVDQLNQEEIMAMISRLPDGYRTVFNLFAIEGKSHKEIAQMLGIKPDSSASQFKRARTMLAKMIKDYRKQV